MTGGKGFVFPAPAGAPHLRHETLEKVYRRTLGMDGKHSVHGWRSAFSTLAKDSGLFGKDAVTSHSITSMIRKWLLPMIVANVSRSELH